MTPATPPPDHPVATAPLRPSALTSLLLGTAVGDALGLPAEGIDGKTLGRLGWNRWRHRLLWGGGMLSDDTEHALFTAHSLIASKGDPQRFERRLAWSLRWWLAALPAGIGLATGRAIIKLWLGFPPRHSGVWSAGNGPAMRSAIIGAVWGDDPARLFELVTRSTRITHTDPRATTGALAVALAAAAGARGPAQVAQGETLYGSPMGDALFRQWRALDPQDSEWQRLLEQMEGSLAEGGGVADFAERIGQSNGVSGYIYHTVPVALYAWLRHPGAFAQTLTAVLDLGGDTDTVGAIAGAIAGASVEPSQIPAEWLEGVRDFPRSLPLVRKTGEALAVMAEGGEARVPGYWWIAVLPRNLLFLVVVLAHGLLRLLPVALRRAILP